ncbi:Fpg/Nei family DNA glycosylase [Candidatus Poriferisocius sp.]|uniref:Fpg/Nei family DNA glycosylase n=1 Tax=Candidatus Poriferisocius sp. TaxID=3101276 RepID=UPI003B02A6A8
MIALPEIETIRRDLDRELSGLRVKSVKVMDDRSMRQSVGARTFADRLDRAKFTGVSRRGLYLIMGLEGEDVVVAHLGRGGRLRRHANKDEIEPDTMVVITFTMKGQLRLVDSTGEAELFLASAENLVEEVPELDGLGIDPLNQPVAWKVFGEMLLAQKAKLKAVLTDDRVVVGLGEVYSDEILFSAGLRYDRLTTSLGPQEVRRLHRAMVETLHDAAKHRGSTLEDGLYVDVHGQPGGYGEHLNVFKQAGRNGRPCPRCHRAIQKYRFRRRWTFYCEQCQI